MNEPPDPGGTVPTATNFVTIECYESGMDTDTSTHSLNKISSRKRNHSHKICKHCNKKKRKNIGGQKDIGCSCMEEIVNVTDLNKPITSASNGLFNPAPNSSQTSSSLSSPVGRRLYNNLDVAPYTVHVQRILSTENDGATLHPITLGKILKQNKINNINNGGIKRLGRNRISISFSNYVDANDFLNNNLLSVNKLKAFIPSFSITRVGIVRGVPTEWSPEEIIENISTPIGCGNILKVRRINYKVMVEGAPIWKPTQSVVLHFDGQILPKRIYICYNALPVDLYIFPTIQCYNCCRFGHTKTQCRSKSRCFRCGEGHSGETCKVDDDCVQCCLCSGAHMANSKLCPELKRQKDIKLYMAQNCVSYAEASKLHPPVSKSFAEILLSPNTNHISRDLPISSNARNLSSPTNNIKTYKKSVFLKPRTPTKVGKGYDKFGHNNILNDYSVPSPPNGCALLQKENINTTESQGPLISETIELLQTLAQSSYYLPPNAAALVDLISQSIPVNNGLQHNPVELPKRSKQQA